MSAQQSFKKYSTAASKMWKNDNTSISHIRVFNFYQKIKLYIHLFGEKEHLVDFTGTLYLKMTNTQNKQSQGFALFPPSTVPTIYI